MGVFNYRDTRVKLFGKAGKGMQLGPGPMDVTFDNTNHANAEIQSVRDQGEFDCATLGDSLEQGWSITINVQALPGSDLVKPRLLDLVKWTGHFADVQTFNPTDDVLLLGLEVLQKKMGRTQRYVLNKTDVMFNFAAQTDRNIWVISGTCRGGIDVS